MKEYEYRTDCYFYHESQDMHAYVPNCSYDHEYEFGFCPCEGCEHYISSKEASELIRGIQSKISELLGQRKYDSVDELNRRLRTYDG